MARRECSRVCPELACVLHFVEPLFGYADVPLHRARDTQCLLWNSRVLTYNGGNTGDFVDLIHVLKSLVDGFQYHDVVAVTYQWRGEFANSEVIALHRDAFESGPGTATEADWKSQLYRNSLGWVTARDGNQLIGFVNVIWDGRSHAWIQDVMVDSASRKRGIGSQLIATTCDATRDVGCEWLHVDFDEGLSKFYFDVCGFVPTSAGLLRLRD